MEFWCVCCCWLQYDFEQIAKLSVVEDIMTLTWRHFNDWQKQIDFFSDTTPNLAFGGATWSSDGLLGYKKSVSKRFLRIGFRASWPSSELISSSYGHGLLIFLILALFWLGETGQIWGFRAFPGERMEGMAWNFSRWYILTTFKPD